MILLYLWRDKKYEFNLERISRALIKMFVKGKGSRRFFNLSLEQEKNLCGISSGHNE